MIACGDMHQSFNDALVKWFFDNFLLFADSFRLVSVHCVARGLGASFLYKCPASCGGSVRQHGFLVFIYLWYSNLREPPMVINAIVVLVFHIGATLISRSHLGDLPNFYRGRQWRLYRAEFGLASRYPLLQFSCTITCQILGRQVASQVSSL